MNKFVILADTTSSLSTEMRKQYDIDYLKMSVTYYEQEKSASLDWDTFSPKEYYDVMRGGERIITGQVIIPEFENKFEEYLSKGFDVLYISCSSALSGSYNTSLIYREQALEKYPDRKIFCLDSRNSAMGQGSMAIKASHLRMEGKTIEEVYEYIEANKQKVLQFGVVEDLVYLKRAGRIKPAKAFFGTLFSVKPIIISNELGENVPWKKANGRHKSIEMVADLVSKYIKNPESQTVYIAHADSETDANTLKDLVISKIPSVKSVVVTYLDPVVGASTGPGTLILHCVGDVINYENE